MLIYHPSKDANHTSYRVISILKNIENFTLSKNKLSFINFYYLFPSQLKKIDKWPRKGTKSFNLINALKDEYEVMENPRRIFFELTEVLDCVIYFLNEKNILTINDQMIKLNIENLPDSVNKVIEDDIFRKGELFRILTKELTKQKLKGESGLKKKTLLMEYRYD